MAGPNVSRDIERSASVSSKSEPTHAGALTSNPPWEKLSLAQVPYMNSTSPSLSNAEREGLTSLWAARETNVSRPKLNTRALTQVPENAAYGSPASPEDEENPWKVQTPLTAPLPIALQAPYDTPVSFPSAPKSAPTLQHIARPPPTPPDSACNSADESRNTSPQDVKSVTALPGTMSARSRTKMSSRSKRIPLTPPSDKDDPAGLGRRFKAAVRDLFKRNAVNESEFERIEDHHWTDE